MNELKKNNNKQKNQYFYFLPQELMLSIIFSKSIVAKWINL